MDAVIQFYWPIRAFIQDKSFKDLSREKYFRLTTHDLNNFSDIFVFEENGFKALLTGDASPFALSKLLEHSNLSVNILKIPHHGSKKGLTKEFLILADPTQTVISVGKNNNYGHPANQILEMLKAQKIQIRYTDLEGNIIFKLKN